MNEGSSPVQSNDKHGMRGIRQLIPPQLYVTFEGIPERNFPEKREDLESAPTLVDFMRNSIRSFTLLVAVGVVLLAFGCGSKDYREMGAVEKAALITKLRTQSTEELKLVQQADGADLDALKRHVELEHQTTQVAPATCPLCYVRYAQALSRLGRYYNVLVGAFRKELEQAAPSERPLLEEKIERYRSEMLATFQRSNQQFEIYFRSGEAIDPRAYEWVFGQYAAMKEYRQALFYLERFVANTTLTPEGRDNAKRLREAYENQVRLQEEAELMRELEADSGDGDDVREARGSGGPRARASTRFEVGN